MRLVELLDKTVFGEAEAVSYVALDGAAPLDPKDTYDNAKEKPGYIVDVFFYAPDGGLETSETIFLEGVSGEEKAYKEAVDLIAGDYWRDYTVDKLFGDSYAAAEPSKAIPHLVYVTDKRHYPERAITCPELKKIAQANGYRWKVTDKDCAELAKRFRKYYR